MYKIETVLVGCLLLLMNTAVNGQGCNNVAQCSDTGWEVRLVCKCVPDDGVAPDPDDLVAQLCGLASPCAADQKIESGTECACPEETNTEAPATTETTPAAPAETTTAAPAETTTAAPAETTTAAPAETTTAAPAETTTAAPAETTTAAPDETTTAAPAETTTAAPAEATTAVEPIVEATTIPKEADEEVYEIHATNNPGYKMSFEFVRTRGLVGMLHPIGKRFKLHEPGFTGEEGTVSIETVDEPGPGFYFRSLYRKLYLHNATNPAEGASTFDKDATFYKIDNNDGTVSFSSTHIDGYIRWTGKLLINGKKVYDYKFEQSIKWTLVRV